MFVQLPVYYRDKVLKIIKTVHQGLQSGKEEQKSMLILVCAVNIATKLCSS